ncbi:MAG: hypothetical protein MK185_06565 [Saccharospirillaceae bacterium]|jgi:hypothetical protein|nr:hypothetical protein [Saccharospirillaceae bacterium]
MHQLGIRTHAELTDIPAFDYDCWRYFFSVEPAGFVAENWRAGVMTASLFNATLQLKGGDGLTPYDLYPDPHKALEPLRPVSASAFKKHLSNVKKTMA